MSDTDIYALARCMGPLITELNYQSSTNSLIIKLDWRTLWRCLRGLVHKACTIQSLGIARVAVYRVTKPWSSNLLSAWGETMTPPAH
jgi:hypothetical protein